MATIVHVKNFSLPRLNNAEYTYFAGQVLKAIEECTVEELHIVQTTYAAYLRGHIRLVELVAQSRISDETALISEVDKEIDELIVFLMAFIRNAKNSPIPAKREAGISLYNTTKLYIGMQNLPQRQQVQVVAGFLADLQKIQPNIHVETLGLTEEVAKLEELNNRYLALIESRAANQLANPVESAKPIRDSMDVLYHEMMDYVFAYSISAPSDTLTGFIEKMNKLIDDTILAYNQRIAKLNKADNAEVGAGVAE